jgi:O-6-methylguanine DNA methyltransferase
MTILYHSRLAGRGLSLSLYSTDEALVGIGLGIESEIEGALVLWLGRRFEGVEVESAGDRHRDYRRQLTEYLEGRRRAFDLPFELRGSEFQKDVWRAVERVPYGYTATYGEIATVIGRPKASRAVGAANGSNPLPIVIPCHRVIGSDGSLTGYGGGLPLKRRLLALEGVLGTPAVQMRLF